MQTAVNSHSKFKKFRELHTIYILLVGVFGFSFAVSGMFQLSTQSDLKNLIILICLAAVAEIAAPFLDTGKIKIAYEVGTAVSLAAVPFYGASTGALIIFLSGISYWLYKYWKAPLAERRWDQLIFNIGMRCSAIFIAGSFLWHSLQLNTSENTFLILLAWVAAAIILDQINLWILIGLLRLLKGKVIKSFEFWLENRWAMLVNIAVEAVGGFALATAIGQFGSLGLFVFFLPIGLSAVSFQLYVRQMQTHMDNLENIIEERTRELANLLKEKDAFLAVLTHDMKTPLTSINLYGSLLLNKPHLAMEKPRMIETIIRGQKTLTNIVNNILDIEKLQSGGSLPTQIESMNLAVLLTATVETLQAQAQSKAITLQYEASMEEIRIKADRGQIERVLQNIISNAVKYTPDEGNVDVQIKVLDQFAQITVADTGYGIPESELPFIFDRFRRVKKHKDKASGTGLGLAITKALIESHDGEISVKSVEEEGTTFTVKLPLAERTRVIS